MIDSSRLAEWLSENYRLAPVTGISLLRSYTNDVYQIDTADGRFVLKIYGRGWRTREAVQYEIDLIDYLDSSGLAVAGAVAGATASSQGEKVLEVPTADGRRLAVLFEFIPGEKPQPPFSPELYTCFGQTIGRFHRISNGFISNHARQSIDLDYLIVEPLRSIGALLPGQSKQLKRLTQIARRVYSKLDLLARQGLDWGPVHGDASLDNLHVVDGERMVLYDFDSGGPGWRASDLQGWAVGKDEYREKHSAFLRGYCQEYELKEPDLEASPYLTAAWDLWGMKVDLERRVISQGQAAVEKYLDNSLHAIQERAIF